LAVVASGLVIYAVIVVTTLTTHVAVFKIFSPRVALVKVAVGYSHLSLVLKVILQYDNSVILFI